MCLLDNRAELVDFHLVLLHRLFYDLKFALVSFQTVDGTSIDFGQQLHVVPGLLNHLIDFVHSTRVLRFRGGLSVMNPRTRTTMLTVAHLSTNSA